MLKRETISNKKLSFNDPIILINYIFAFFPVSFIFGNLVTNINLALFCILGIFYLRSKIFEIKLNLILKVIFLFFFIIFFSTSLSFIKSLYIDGYEYNQLVRLVKSIVFFRYFLMLLIIYHLSELNILNFKYFFGSAALVTLIVASDVIFQYIFGFNIIGLEGYNSHNSGFFGKEWIAGGFIQNFSFFAILFSFFILKKRNNLRFVLILVTICLLGSAILYSGNRAPLILFFLGLFLLFVFNKKLRKVITVSAVCFFMLFKFVFLTDPTIRNSYQSAYHNITGLFSPLHKFNVETTLNREKENSEQKIENEQYLFPVYPQYDGFFRSFDPRIRLFLTSIDTWKKNKIFGNGIKSFRIDCFSLVGSAVYPERGYNLYPEVMLFKNNRLCSNHPHNYYFEILTETGIVGIVITFIIAILFIFFILKNFKIFNGNNIEHFILLAATISLILEVFPFKPTGSIFTTNVATYIILLLSIILSYYKKLPMRHNG